MKLWITRTEPDAQATAARLAAFGHEAVVAPLLQVRILANLKLDLAGVTALAFTSRNGVSAFCALTRRRKFTVYAVGDATAEAARGAGFQTVFSAEGDVAELAALITANPPAGKVLWPAPVEPASDLCALLEAQSLPCLRQPVYETVPTEVEAPPALDGVIVHSAKAARCLARRLTPEAARVLRLYAISAQAAGPLSDLPFAGVEIASAPNETALLDLTVRPIGANQRTMTSIEPASLDTTPAGAIAADAVLPADPSLYRKQKGVSRTALILACLGSVVLGVAISRLVPGLPQATGNGDAAQPAPWFGAPARPDTAEEPAAAPAPAAAPSAEVAGLAARLDRVEATQRTTARAAGAALATATLSQAAQTSRPFTAELAAVENLLPGVDTSALRRNAATGAPTRGMLAEEFPASAARASAAANAPSEGAGLFAQIKHAMAAVVTIRRVEGGKGADGVIATAERMVNDGDLEGALIEMRRLSPAARNAFVPWLAKADRRIEIDRRIAGIRADSLAALDRALGAAPVSGPRP